MSKLNGKVALVTGAADGIGAACARELGEQGATVVVTDINLAGAAQVAESIGDNALALEHNVCEESAWRMVIDDISRRYGRLDVLVNNAGGSGAGNIEDTDLDFYRNCMTLNVDSIFMGTQMALALMKTHGGSVINIASIHGIKAASYAAPYTAAKGAVTMLSKAIALHCAENGYPIRCNSVHPGYIKTPQMLKFVDEQEDPKATMDGLVSKHPIGFLGEPEDIAKGVAYLASDDSRFVTGSALIIDGGFSI